MFKKLAFLYHYLVPKERALFLKEQNSNMYSVSAYYFGRTITELPFLIIFPIGFSLIIYWAMGLNTDGSAHFFIFGYNLKFVKNY